MPELGLDSFAYHYAGGLWEYSPGTRMTADDYLAKAAELGLDGVQFCDTRHFPDLSEQFIDHLRGEAEGLGLYVELGTGGIGPDDLHGVIRAASRVGSPVVRTFVGEAPSHDSTEVGAWLRARAVPLTAAAAVCETYGVSLAIENHCDVTTAELVRLIEMVGSPWVGICFDNGNTLALFEDPVEAAALAAPFTKSVHLKDYQIAPTRDGYLLVGCALGEGIVDLRGVLDILIVEAPDASLNIETFVGTYPVAWPAADTSAGWPEEMRRGVREIREIVLDRGLSRPPVLPLDSGAPEAAILEHEDALVHRSVAWAQQALDHARAR